MSEEERLREVLRYAIQMLEAYETEIRNSSLSLVDQGFCQGVIFREAVPRLKGLLDAEVEG